MVLDLETRLSNLSQFDRWPYQARPQSDSNDLSRTSGDHRSSQTTWTSSYSALGHIVDYAGTWSRETHGRDVGMYHVSGQSLPGNLQGHVESPLGRQGAYQDIVHVNATPSTTEHKQQVDRRRESRGSFLGAQNITNIAASTPETTHIRCHRASTNSAPGKRMRSMDDVDGPGTGHLSSKKRRLRLQLITSRLSQPFSLPATHILNRESDEDTPVISQFVKLAALRAKKAGHQTAMVRKAAILNRVRLNVRHTAVARGHDKIWRMTRIGAMSHGLQLVTDSTGAMFPGRSGEQVPGPIVPRAWRPHTTATSTATPAGLPMVHIHTESSRLETTKPPHATLLDCSNHQAMPADTPPPTLIMTPLAGADDDEASFPDSELDSVYADNSDEDMDVYADFGVLFGGAGGSASDVEEADDHFYEEYLDEVDGIIWAS